MSWIFEFVLLVHILAVLLMVAAIGLQATIAMLNRAATTPDEARQILKATRWIPRLFAPATALILLSGIYMGTILVLARQPWGWMAVSLVAVIALAAWSKSSGQKCAATLGRLLAECDSTLSPQLEAVLRDPAPLFHIALGVWVVAGIVVLMVFQPGIWGSLAVIVIALLATVATRQVAVRRSAAGVATADVPAEVKTKPPPEP